MAAVAVAAVAAAVALLLVLGACAHVPEDTADPDYWPTDGWRRDSPASRGMDPADLAAMFDTLAAGGYLVDAVLVIRDGYVVAEGYRSPFTADRRHQVHSCTKSVIGACVGIAIADGWIEGVDATLPELFPGAAVDAWSPAKRTITLKDMLTMSTGLDTTDSYLYGWTGLNAMQQSPDWLQYALARPLAAAPGTRFDYSNITSFLLSAAITQATGESAADLAARRLFAPLGIRDVYWPESPGGIATGWGNLRMRAEDLAKIGFLYLQRGRWQDEQVVPAEWVSDSWAPYFTPRTLRESYGYQWWMDDQGSYMALGYRGQYLIVRPDSNLVVVFFGNLEDPDFTLPYRLYRQHVLPSLDPAGPPGGDLAEAIARFSRPTGAHQADSLPSAPPPDGYERWSGVYNLADNVFDMTALEIAFGHAGDAVYTRRYENHAERFAVGPPDAFALTQADRYAMAFRGGWDTEGAYHIYYTAVGEAWWTRLRLSFTGRSVRVDVTAASGYRGEFTGRRLP